MNIIDKILEILEKNGILTDKIKAEIEALREGEFVKRIIKK